MSTATIVADPGVASTPAAPYHGVLSVAAATVVMAVGFGSLGLMSVFMQPLESQFGWSRSDTSLVYAIATVGMAVGGLFWGRMSDRADLRTLLVVGGLGTSAALLYMATVGALWQLYLANAVLGALGFSVLYAPALATSGDWFPSRRGLVTGIVTAGGALGQGVVPFAASVLISTVGWRLAYLSIAAAVVLSLTVALPLLRRPGATVRSATGQQTTNQTPERSYHDRVAVLAVAAFLCCACMGVPLVHLASFVGAICASPSLGATSLLVAMVFGAIGRICFGHLADRTGPVLSYSAASATQTVCVIAYPFLSDSASIVALSALFGFGFAGNMTCLLLCVRQTVPAQRFGGAVGTVMLVAWAGMASGGYLGGRLFDLYLDYTLAFWASGLAGLLNLLAILVLQRMQSLRSPRVPPPRDPLGYER